MSVQANIVINDGQSTPVAKTFLPRGADMALAKYVDTSGGISIGMPTLTIGNKVTEGANGTYRTEARLTLPILEVISGDAGGYTPAPKVAYKMFAKVELIAPNRSTLQNRKDLRALVANLLDHATISETFVDFNPPN